MICHLPSLALLNPFAQALAGRKTVRSIFHGQVGEEEVAGLELRYGGKFPWRGGFVLP